MTSNKSWLLYSHRFIDLEVLSASLQKHLHTEVELRYQEIYCEGKQENHTDDPVRAIHLEIDAKDSERVDPILSKLYSSQSDSYPNGIKLRLIPEYSSL